MDSGRLEGRGLEEFRPAFFKTKVLNSAAGSAFAEIGNTKVLVAVHGPRQSERKFGFSEEGRLECTVSLSAFAHEARPGPEGSRVKARAELDLARTLQQALLPCLLLDKLPKATVDVNVFVMESSGSDIAAAICAAALALADAGIEVYDLVAACCLARRADDGALLLDPDSQEQHNQAAGAVLAAMSNANKVTTISMMGQWNSAQMEEALDLALGGCAQLRVAMRGVLLEVS